MSIDKRMSFKKIIKKIIMKYYYKLKLLFFYINVFILIVVYYRDGKAEFSASLLQSPVSNNPSEINWIGWFGV